MPDLDAFLPSRWKIASPVDFGDDLSSFSFPYPFCVIHSFMHLPEFHFRQTVAHGRGTFVFYRFNSSGPAAGTRQPAGLSDKVVRLAESIVLNSRFWYFDPDECSVRGCIGISVPRYDHDLAGKGHAVSKCFFSFVRPSVRLY